MFTLDIDGDAIDLLRHEMGATPEQVNRSIRRALSRTSTTLQKLARRELKDGLDLRRVNSLRKRLKSFRVKANGNSFSVDIWAGLNDMLIGDIKGRPRKTGSGARFRDKDYPGAFVAKRIKGSDRKLTIYKRAGRNRYPIIEQTYPVDGKATDILEGRVLSKAPEIFMQHFTTDLRSRVRFEDSRWSRRNQSGRS